MPWVSIVIFLISYFLSKDNGKSDGEAAAIGAAAGLATYYVADPANKDNLMGLSFGGAEGSAKVNAGAPGETVARALPSTFGSLGSSVISESAGVLKSWGPTGTLGVVAGSTALSSFDWKKYAPWLLAGAAFFLLKS